MPHSVNKHEELPLEGNRPRDRLSEELLATAKYDGLGLDFADQHLLRYTAHHNIPRIRLHEHLRKFVDELPRPLITSTDRYDISCPICHCEYGTEVNEDGQNDEAIQLRCGHISGSRCLLQWIMPNPEASCPFCRERLVLPTLSTSRAQDAQRFLFWFIRTYGIIGGNAVLLGLEMYQRERDTFIIGRIDESVDESNVEIAARVLSKIEKRNQDIARRSSPEYMQAFQMMAEPRAAQDGMTIMQFVRTYMTRTVASCILYQMSEKALLAVAAPFARPEAIEMYRKDSFYGPDGCYEEFWRFLNIGLEYPDSVERREQNIKMDQWICEFPESILHGKAVGPRM